MKVQKSIGNDHVIKVAELINNKLHGTNSQAQYDDTVLKTVHYIINKFPNSVKVRSKFASESPDNHSDIMITLDNNKVIRINLFKIKGQAKIQPKNLGALSFLKKYFLTENLQQRFNLFIEEEYKRYLKQIIKTQKVTTNYNSMREMKKIVKKMFPKFNEEINPIRNYFLFNLREYCYELLSEEYNNRNNGINNAFRKLLLLDSKNIITRYKDGNKCLSVEELNFQIDPNEKIYLFKNGKNSIGIRVGSTALLLRFKFESNPTSSIKLATSYEIFEVKDNEITQNNLEDIKRFEELISQHFYQSDGNKSNAIGKCNEAITYYQVLKENPTINQVEPDEYKQMFIKYSPLVTKSTINKIITTATSMSREICNYIKLKHDEFIIDSIQLVPDSYLEDRLDTSDLKIGIIKQGKLIEEAFSLKAYKKRVKKLTSKNPGVGTILGDQYFGIGTMKDKIKEVKEEFLAKSVDHQHCLEVISGTIGDKLGSASQSELKRGIQALLGKAPLAVSFYEDSESIVLEHGDISTKIKVIRNYPSSIQNTLIWNDDREELSLRVKFSGGHSRGWTSLKLSCEVKIN
ncbi:hypothetical protein [Evansella halocellulosilytica]|uniref:hypothetical protein n=1 Tax=Evansella halocellulosilytica TaxID=2011013 RepID=UPI000BB8CA16|nr:hypothetical protein [Evansella halocellulosilytica]